ncbi:Uncharacterised protein [Mycobacteroides abscessus subsp. abscessus]|nr:Uncharacterised protein [Mycobacteroides abscessus subsp. abscessus]
MVMPVAVQLDILLQISCFWTALICQQMVSILLILKSRENFIEGWQVSVRM